MDTTFVVLIVLAVYLLFIGFRESFDDKEFTNVTRPDSKNGGWKSKIQAQAPIGANEADYIRSLQVFYDKVYKPAATKPTIADVEKFLASSDVVGKSVDAAAMRLIIVDAFHIQSTQTGAQKEKNQIKFDINPADLEPSNGRDEVRVRAEANYKPSDPVFGKLPEGNYAPVNQQSQPRHPGITDYKTIGKTSNLFYDVCVDSKKPGCEQNVL
jgi:hypothetical protein